MSHPKEWIKVKFEQIVRNITDRIDKPSESGLDYYIGLEHLDTDQIRIKRFGSTADVNATKFLCKKGDIIFGKRNSYLRKVAVTDRDAVVSAHSMIFRPTGNLIEFDFLPCFLQSSTFWRIAHAVSEGSMSPTIKWKIISKQEFFIPPIEEQKKIAKLLWAIEDNIEKTEKLISINEKLKRGLLKELLTKGIGHKKFKKTKIGEIPEEWDLVQIKDVAKIQMGKTPSRKNKSYWNSGTNTWVSIRDLNSKIIIDSREKITDLAVNESGIKVVPKGTLIMSFKLTLGKLAYAGKDLFTNEAIVSFYPNKKIDQSFLYLILSNYNFDSKVAQAVKGKTLNKEKILKLELQLPKLEEQINIINFIKPSETTIEKFNQHLVLLNNLKKKLTDEIMKGEVRV